MLNIFDIPLYYISFDPKPKLENQLSSLGFTDINYFQAIRGKNFKPLDLLRDNKITSRAYDDLIKGRVHHTGLPSLGCVGCTMSHYEIWKKCEELNLDYVIIVEDDVNITRKINDRDIQIINDILSNPNSVYMSSLGKSSYFWGTYFYIVSKDASKILVENAFPMDIQTDMYICLLNNINKINVGVYRIYNPIPHYSSIQTFDNFKIKMLLPMNNFFYLMVIVVLIIFVSKYKQKY
jgi:GR25 family glycosyltransferase involved in LPS biosynthesis